MEPLTFARSYATLHHVIRKGQLYGVVPYTHHLAAVEEVLRGFGENRSEMLVAAWLHDIVEDTDVKVRDVEENFGPEVASLVSAVTSEDGPNRKTRNALTYPKIREAGPDAVRLKLADRIANVSNGGSSVEMYRKEHATFKHALFSHDDGNQKMWMTLDALLQIVKE
jgi:(p)ppGpp synthase/HD superfamily hydrolase